MVPLLLLGSPVPLAGQELVPPDGPSVLSDLAAVLDTGVVLQDQNDDGVVDGLALRLLLAPNPTEAEVAAAANLAARFGFETSGTDLGLAGPTGPGETPETPVILVGARALDAAGIGGGGSAELLADLAPGQGILSRVLRTRTRTRGGLVVVGYDATGLLAASGYLSGRYPGVWDPEGVTWRDLKEKVDEFLQGRGFENFRVVLDEIVVEEGLHGIARAQVEVSGIDGPGPDFDAAVAAFLGEDTVSVGEEEPGEEVPVTEVDPGEMDPVEEGRGEQRLELTDLEFRGLHRLDVRIQAHGAVRTITLRPEDPWDLRDPPAFRRGGDATFALPDIYRVGGLYRDTNRDLVPDETAGFISLGGPEASDEVIDLATRIGLETAGARLPLVEVGAGENDPTQAGFPLLFGTDHYQIRRLQEEDKLPGTEVGPGQGFVQFVENAFGDRNALAVGAEDEAGLSAVARWMAHQAPYLWTYGKGEYHLSDAQTDVRRFLQGRRASGQLALALTKLNMWMERLENDPPQRIEVEIAAEEAPAGLNDMVAAVVGDHFPNAQVSVDSWPTGFGVGDTIFVQEWDLPWELDEVRELLEEDVYPRIRTGQPASVEVRVSEPPEIRAELEEEIREALADRGATAAMVHVLSAYKQGYSWINDVLLPQLRGKQVASIDLTYHTLEESEEVRWQTIAAETRWLQEVYPIDAVLARELGIGDSVVAFHPTREKDPIYTFEARDSSGSVILSDTFDPRYVVRPFFDLFPEYEQVRVTTGWVTATAGDQVLVDQRIVTDPERFWDRLQTETYGELIAYVMDIQDGNPAGDNAPFFDEFRVDLRLSEPDYRIGVDEEIVSSLEALHEDLYFETHTLFSLIGGRYQTSLSNPGRVLPFVDPSGAGMPGKARLTLTGKERGNPELLVRTWASGESEPLLQRYELNPLPTPAPSLSGVVVGEGEEGLAQVRVRVTVPDSVDRYEEFAVRSSESGIDRQFLSVELLEKMLESLIRLHDAGMMEDVLSWDRVEALALDFRLEKDSTYQKSVVLPRSRNPKPTQNPRLTSGDWEYEGERLAQWDSPMSLAESEDVLAKLGSFPGVDAYFLTESFLGNRVWAADFLPPQTGTFISQAKLNALKPTLFVSGREHANEVSSTNHILRLGELLVTDSAYQEMLKKVNVVLHPVTNPDGVSVAYERQLVNPDHMLHAGRPGALGTDATSGGSSSDPVYPESQARRMIREAWLPDIYINPHGYPSHEWVQYFAGYSAWARGRRVGPRTWWVPRGWFIPGFSWVEDEENPDYQTAQFAILDTMAAAVTGNEAVHDMNQRLYARYKKYGEQDRDGFTEYFHNGMVVSMRLRGTESIGNGLNSPRITYFSVTTEAPDETARGGWMDLMGQVGLAHTTSTLRYLATGEFEVEREAEAFDQAVVRKIFRVKPVLPPKDDDEKDEKEEVGK